MYFSGKLHGVIGLSGSYNSPEELVLHWFEPPSLSGIPIFGYTLVVDIRSALEEVLLSSQTVYLTNTNFTITEPFGTNCTVVQATVFANNAVGLGDPTNTTVYFQES